MLHIDLNAAIVNVFAARLNLNAAQVKAFAAKVNLNAAIVSVFAAKVNLNAAQIIFPNIILKDLLVKNTFCNIVKTNA